MLNADQIAQLQLMEQTLVQITESPEYKALSAEGFHHDLYLCDALQAISQLLDNHCPSTPYSVAPGFTEMFSDASLLNNLQVLGDK